MRSHAKLQASILRYCFATLCVAGLSVAALCSIASPLAAQQSSSFASPKSAESSRSPLSAPAYQLQVGDSVDIFYRMTPEYNQTVTILPGGDVSLQLLGTVHLAGLDLQQAHDAILTRAAARLRDPEVSLSLKDVNKDHYAVIGEVTTPGKYDLHGPVSVMEALATAGGFRSTSSQQNVLLVRRLSPNSEYGEVSQIDFRKLRRLNTTTELPMVHNGDVVWVTASKLAKIERLIKLANLGVYYPLP